MGEEFEYDIFVPKFSFQSCKKSEFMYENASQIKYQQNLKTHKIVCKNVDDLRDERFVCISSQFDP